jgi:hypothetical protein
MDLHIVGALVSFILLMGFTSKLKLPHNVAGSAILAIAWPAVLVALFLLTIKVRVLKMPLKNSLRDTGVALMIGVAAMGYTFWGLGYFNHLDAEKVDHAHGR